MSLRRTSHAVYEAKYHLVWCPKYRKKILDEEIRPRVKELFEEIASHFDFEIDRCEVCEDHVHILVSFPPRYSVARVVGILKSISGSKVFKEFPKVKPCPSHLRRFGPGAVAGGALTPPLTKGVNTPLETPFKGIASP